MEANQFTYNALIAACEKGGQWGAALVAYKEMCAAGLPPDQSTYNPLLNALWEGEQCAYAQASCRGAPRPPSAAQPHTPP